jgi:carbon-monoxide dehydrogenase small subunit
MSAIELIDGKPDISETEIRQGLEGNLCRCTGYQNIVKSIMAAADKIRDEANVEKKEIA